MITPLEQGSHRQARAAAHHIVVLVAAATLLVASDWQAQDWLAAVPYMLALVLLSLMDVELPHGDSVDVDAAVIIAAAYIYGPVVAAGIVIISRIAAHLLRHQFSFNWAVISSVAKRLVGVSGGLAVLWLLPAPPWGRVQLFVEVLVLGLAYVGFGLVYSQISLSAERGDSILRMAVSNIALQGPVLAAGVSVGILTVLIHDEMGVWGLALVLFLAVMTRQSFALLLDVRQGYQATIEALIGAMEAQKTHAHGVGREVAIMARAAGAEYGWFGKSLENMGYAALLLYFGLNFVTRDVATGETRPTPLSDVHFLRPVAPIVEAAENPDLPAPTQRHTLVAAYIVSLCVARLSSDTADNRLAVLRGQLTPRERWRSEAAVEAAAQKCALV